MVDIRSDCGRLLPDDAQPSHEPMPSIRSQLSVEKMLTLIIELCSHIPRPMRLNIVNRANVAPRGRWHFHTYLLKKIPHVCVVAKWWLVASLMSLTASLVTTSRKQQYFKVFIDIHKLLLLLFNCCIPLEIKLTTTNLAVLWFKYFMNWHPNRQHQ